VNPRHLAVALVVAITAAAAPAAADTHAYRCGLVDRLPQLHDRAKPAPVAHAGPGKVLRDGFGGPFTGVRESANFAVKWQSADVSEEKAQTILDTLEASWVVYAAIGHVGPTGTDTFKLNAYIHNINDNPSIEFDGGYASIDDEGYPYFVISANIEDTETIQHVTAHELYHDYQLSLPAFQDFSAYWFWESTADWAAQEVYPASSDGYSFVGGYALLPELALFSAGDPFAKDPLPGYHQYGASIFERFLTDREDDPTLIATAWESSQSSDDPLRVLDGLLAEGSTAEVFAAMAAHNTVWDYPQRDLILPWIDYFAAAFPSRPPFHATVFGDGTGGFLDSPATRPLHSWGYHHIRLLRPDSGVVEISLELDAQGSLGTSATWFATVVGVPATGAPEYTAVPISGGTGELTVTLPEGEGDDIHYLAIGLTGDSRDDTETFAYRYRIAPGDAPAGPDAGPGEEPGDDPGGCCSTGGGGASGSALLALLVGLVVARRRRIRSR
jgi:MYXO-CTERM domain-containing protein